MTAALLVVAGFSLGFGGGYAYARLVEERRKHGRGPGR